jgi:predicted PurR-regulated permease PerM
MLHWPSRRRNRAYLTVIVVSLVLAALYLARRALTPFFLGAFLAYLVAPAVDWICARLPQRMRLRRAWRGLIVLLVYLIVTASLVIASVFLITPIVEEFGILLQRLPELGNRIYSAAPDVVRTWLDEYNLAIPANVRQAIEKYLQNLIPSALTLIEQGVATTLGLAFTTLSFVLGLVVVPLWMFYVLRDQSDLASAFYRVLPASLREDARNVLALTDSVLGAYLRGQVLLCLSVGAMTGVGLTLLRVDFALLLSVIAGIFEVVPVLGPFLGAIPALLVTLATSPSLILWVALLAFAVQQIENVFLVPQIHGTSVRLHPAAVMLVLVVGSEIAGVLGVILCVPLTAVFRDVSGYLYLRLAEEPVSPAEAMGRMAGRA